MSEVNKANNAVNDNGLFTEEELIVRRTNMERRESMLEELFSNGAPTKSGDMRVAKEIIEASDNAILTTAKLRKDAEKQEDNAKISGLILATIMASAKNNQNKRRESVVISLGDEHIPEDIIDGELEDGIKQLAMIDYIDEED